MPSRIEELCRERGLKMTGQRRIIAQVLSDAEDHPDAEEVYRRASLLDDKISMATVYRTVRLFEEAEILDRHDFGDGRARYETAQDDGAHHHHIINVKTGDVIEFENQRLEELKQQLAADLGFKIVGERLELYCVPADDNDKKKA
jgi:Fur family ferric uptake transcriptional regulator